MMCDLILEIKFKNLKTLPKERRGKMIIGVFTIGDAAVAKLWRARQKVCPEQFLTQASKPTLKIQGHLKKVEAGSKCWCNNITLCSFAKIIAENNTSKSHYFRPFSFSFILAHGSSNPQLNPAAIEQGGAHDVQKEDSAVSLLSRWVTEKLLLLQVLCCLKRSHH